MSHDNPAKESEPRWGDSADRERERGGDKPSSATPRTETALCYAWELDKGAQVVRAGFARQLERELAEKNEALAVAESTINDLRVDLDVMQRDLAEELAGHEALRLLAQGWKEDAERGIASASGTTFSYGGPEYVNTAEAMPEHGQVCDLILECGSELTDAVFNGRSWTWRGQKFTDFTVEWWRSETVQSATAHAMLKALAGDPVILAGSDEAELRLRYAAMLAATPACASPNRNVAKRLRQASADGDWGAVEDIADLLDERLDK